MNNFSIDWLEQRAALTPERIALVDAARDELFSYTNWNKRVCQTARLLQGLGVKRGDRVALVAHNAIEWLDVWFACAKLAAVLQPLNWRLSAPELAALIRDGEPQVLIYGPECAELVAPLRRGLQQLQHWISLGEPRGAGDLSLSVRASLSAEPLAPVERSLDDAWALCGTGGSTGTPKQAVLTYRAIRANALQTVAGWQLDANDAALLNAPLFHTGGMNVFTMPLFFMGGASVVCRAFDPDQVFDLLERRTFTVMFGVPTMFIALQAHARWARSDWSHLKLVISGGAPCPPPVFEAFFAKGVAFRTGYGLTEAGPNNFALPNLEVRRKPGAVGVPLPGVEMRILDGEGQPCAANEVGELWIRGEHVCAGYWRRPKETSETFVEGWLRTGDLAERDADGIAHIVGRAKDLIISGGENVYPSEVEAVLAMHPAIAEVAVVGAPDPKWGEVPAAVVVIKPGSTLALEELQAFCAERLARYKQPRILKLREALPRTGAGKVDRKALTSWIRGER